MTEKIRLLPEVTPDVASKVLEELKKDPKGYLRNLSNLLAEENPQVAGFIGELSKLSSDPHNIAVAGTIVYQLIKAQIESDYNSPKKSTYNITLKLNDT